MITDTINSNWKLKSIEIQYQDWGDYKGKYVGKIKFENQASEAFMFNLTPEKTEKYLQLISEEVVNSASKLGEELLKSLNLLPYQKTIEVEAKVS